jgi:hypothetical protein
MIRNLIIALAITGSMAAIASPAFADDLCSDRPGQGVSSCTVPAGHIQTETSLYQGSFINGSSVNQFGATTLKYGVTSKIDLEVGFSGAEEVNYGRTHTWGNGDLFIGGKIELLNSFAQVSLAPYFKAPIASAGLGNGAWEGGFAAPISYSLSKKLTLNLSPAISVVQDEVGPDAGHGVHVQTSQVVNLTYALTPKLSASTEVAAAYDFQGVDGAKAQYWSDVSAAYLLTPKLQLDTGVNVGLNRYTPNQVYVGVTKRF